MSCPAADALAGFAAGALEANEASAIEVHIDGCEACRAALSSAVRGAAPQPHFGRYRVDTVLGAGGMGLVYRAYDPELARAVAIKVVRAAEGSSANDAGERSRLAREARALARLSHPNVCHVYDVGEHEGEVWVAMELVDGVDLRQWATGRPAEDILRALLDAARGIAAAHDAGLVHRDIKPQNVLMTRDGRAVVTDFGLARSDERATTSAAAEAAGLVRISGTPAYLGPEQLTGAPVDARADQFAWAVMAWELLAGERPFPIEPAARLAAIRAGLTIPRTLSPGLGAALSRALAAASRDRFASMGDLIAAIDVMPTAQPPFSPRIRNVLLASAGLGIIAAITILVLVIAGPLRPHRSGSSLSPTDALIAAPAVAEAEPVTAATPDAGAAAAAAPDAAAVPAALAVSGTRKDAGVSRDASLSTVTTAAATLDAGVAIPVLPDAAPPPSPATAASSRFDRARAERRLADCRFPVDPRHPDPALAKWGQVVDWGPVLRRESVIGVGKDGEHTMLMYEIDGARGRYRFDGDAFASRLGTLDVPVGTLVVVCPFALPAVAEVDHRALPPGWRSPSPPIYAFAPSTTAPAIATRLGDRAPLHVPEPLVRSLATKPSSVPSARNLLVFATPKHPPTATEPRWDMGGWFLDVADLPAAEAAHLVAKRPIWLVADRVTVENGQATLHAIVALRRLLD